MSTSSYAQHLCIISCAYAYCMHNIMPHLRQSLRHRRRRPVLDADKVHDVVYDERKAYAGYSGRSLRLS